MLLPSASYDINRMAFSSTYTTSTEDEQKQAKGSVVVFQGGKKEICIFISIIIIGNNVFQLDVLSSALQSSFQDHH